MCYRKKTKCELEGPSLVCVQCARRRTKCVFPGQQARQEKDDETRYRLHFRSFGFSPLLFLEYAPIALRLTESISSEQYVQSLKDRLVRVESLLQAAGILQESDLSHDTLLDGEEEDLPDETGDSHYHKNQNSPGHSSYLSSRSSDHDDAISFPGGGDVEVTSIFKGHERDDSRYFG